MIEFINEAEKTPEEVFDTYFEEVITPLVESENKIKDKYRSRFWASLWTVLFLVSINVLITLFRAVMYDHHFNYDQLMLVCLVAIVIIVWPIISYRYHKKTDVFNEFLKFYGNWNHVEDNKVVDVQVAQATNQSNEVNHNNVKIIDGHLPIVPEHNILNIGHNAVGEYNGIQIQMRDADYCNQITIGGMKMQRTVTSGVRLNFTMPTEFPGMIVLFDKTGFYRKNKFLDFEPVKSIIPAAGYFNIFSNNSTFAADFLRVDFFETILDLKDVFKAKKIYVEIRNNTVKVFLEGSALYFDSFRFWSQRIDKNRFRNLHEQFGKTLIFAQTIRLLAEQR